MEAQARDLAPGVVVLIEAGPFAWTEPPVSPMSAPHGLRTHSGQQGWRIAEETRQAKQPSAVSSGTRTYA